MTKDEDRQAGGLHGRTYAGQGYDPTYLARKHGISKQQARDLIRKVGHDRDKLNAAAIALRACST